MPTVLPLSDAQIRQFRTQGYCTHGPLFSEAEIADMLAEFDRLRDRRLVQLGTREDGPLDYQPCVYVESPLLLRYVSDERWCAIMFQLIGPDVRMYWEQGVAKPPYAKTELPWHQDNGYAPTLPEEYVTCWLALDDATRENGCIWVLPGSHTRGTVKHRAAGPSFRSGYDGPEPGIAVPVKRGEVLLFSSLILHRSGPNVTERPRRSWIIQFCAADAIHANTGKPLTDRLLVARGGKRLAEPYSERPIDIAEVYATWTPVE